MKFKGILDASATPHKVGGQHVCSGKESEKLNGTLQELFWIQRLIMATSPVCKIEPNKRNS